MILKSCPFCGKSAMNWSSGDTRCSDDRCNGASITKIERWNRRPIEAALLDAVKLVLVGLERGNVKANPIMPFDPNAKELKLMSLEEILQAAIAKAEGRS